MVGASLAVQGHDPEGGIVCVCEAAACLQGRSGTSVPISKKLSFVLVGDEQ
jgi:hypothetical protein